MGRFSDGDRHESSLEAGGAKFIGVDHISLMAASLRKLVFCYPANLALAVFAWRSASAFMHEPLRTAEFAFRDDPNINSVWRQW
jgi:hypothetical protein